MSAEHRGTRDSLTPRRTHRPVTLDAVTKRQRGLVLVAIFAVVVVLTVTCNQVASNRVERQIEQKEDAVRGALAAFDPARPTGFDPERSPVTRFGLESFGGAGEPGAVFATAEARWAWEARCVVGRRLESGAIDTRVVYSACSDVHPLTVFPTG